MSEAKFLCSIVIPVYYNEKSLRPLLDSLRSEVMAKQREISFEVIFVDDGSGDDSHAVCAALHKSDPELVSVIRFTRNFGQVPALYAGFERARGDCVVAMSADLQDPVSLINDMLREFFNGEADVVVCSRRSRDESLYRNISSKFFYAMIRRLSFPNMPEGGFDFVLMGRRALVSILQNQEAHPFFQGSILWTGFRMKYIPYDRQKRAFGTSRWTFAKKITYLLDGALAYSFLPIRVISIIGIVVALSGFIYAAVILLYKILGGIPIVGWAPLMIVILVIGGIQMLMLGLIGEYLWRTLAQVRKRPLYIIDTVLEGSFMSKEAEIGAGVPEMAVIGK